MTCNSIFVSDETKLMKRENLYDGLFWTTNKHNRTVSYARATYIHSDANDASMEATGTKPKGYMTSARNDIYQ